MKVKMTEKRDSQQNLRDQWQRPGEFQDTLALFRRQPDEFKTVHETCAVPDHGSQDQRLGQVGNGELERNHFARDQCGRDNATQSGFCDLMTSALKPDVSVLAKNRNRKRKVRTMSGKTPALGAAFGRHVRLATRFCHLSRNLPGYALKITENKQRWDVSAITLDQSMAWRKFLWEDTLESVILEHETADQQIRKYLEQRQLIPRGNYIPVIPFSFSHI
jgi:hypothetical protein